MSWKSLTFGVLLAMVGRPLFRRILLLKFGCDVAKLNAGDYSSLLDAYAEDFVLHFNDGDHRWAGEWVGKDGMERFLKSFTAAKIQGEIRQISTSGPLWALTMWVRFDDSAQAPDGRRIYENQTVLVLRTKWGKIVEQDDFYFDTGRIVEFDRELTAVEARTNAESS